MESYYLLDIIKKNKLLIKLNLETPEFFKYVCGSTPGIKIDNYYLIYMSCCFS